MQAVPVSQSCNEKRKVRRALLSIRPDMHVRCGRESAVCPAANQGTDSRLDGTIQHKSLGLDCRLHTHDVLLKSDSTFYVGWKAFRASLLRVLPGYLSRGRNSKASRVRGPRPGKELC